MKVEINDSLIKDIQHLIVWYQGRQTQKCENVEKWLDKISKQELYPKIKLKCKVCGEPFDTGEELYIHYDENHNRDETSN